jgi:hypothetical protein
MADDDDLSALNETPEQAASEAAQTELDARAAVGSDFDSTSDTELEELESEQ